MRNSSYWPAIICFVVGLLMLVGLAVFWGITHRESVLFVQAAVGLIGVGGWTGFRISIRISEERSRKHSPFDDEEDDDR